MKESYRYYCRHIATLHSKLNLWEFYESRCGTNLKPYETCTKYMNKFQLRTEPSFSLVQGNFASKLMSLARI